MKERRLLPSIDLSQNSMEQKTVCEKDKCTGCMACVDVCPRNAIQVIDTMRSYNAVKNENCIECGACQKKCQQNNPPLTLQPKYMYQGWCIDVDLRTSAASGGYASAISEAFIKSGGIVCSCTFENGSFCFVTVDNTEDLGKFSGSKYVKSDPTGAYSKVLNLLKSDKKCLFVGLPCQVAAMKNFIPGSLQEQLYTIDLICHGTPSPKLLVKFLGQYDISLDDLDSISFRSKEPTKDMTILAQEGTCDYYSLAFSHCQIFTSNCYECKHAKIERVSDITLGDSWGSELPAEETKKGISLVLCQTAKGKELLDNAEIKLIGVDTDRAIAHNDQLRHPSVKPETWGRFFDRIENNTKFNKAVFNVLPKACLRQFIKYMTVKFGLKKTDGINYSICIKEK